MRQLFFELSEMKDVKYPKKVWIDFIYRDSIWLEEHTRWKEDASFLLYMNNWPIRERALPCIKINWNLF